MRHMLLSFKAEVYHKVVSGEKIYEHRKNFPNETITAYLYVGKPIQSIVGIMHLSNREDLSTWLDKYAFDDMAVARIRKYLERYRYVMEITDYQHTNLLGIDEVKRYNPSFSIPYMYYYLDDTPLLKYLKENLHPEGEIIRHSFENITSDRICNS